MTNALPGNPYQTDPVYDRWLGDLDSLKLFEYASRSQSSRAQFSRGRGWMKQLDSQTAKLMRTMGDMVARHRSLLDVGMAVIRTCNPHASIAEWNSKIFESAREVLAGKFDDVERRSGPESFRRSECMRDFTRAEKLIVLETLFTLMDDYRRGLGWAAKRCAEELNVIQFMPEPRS